MIRTVAFIAHVLAVVAPNFAPRAQAASHLVSLGRKHHFDPLTLVAIVEHESHWNPTVIAHDKGDGGYRGLAQIRLANFETCRIDPVRYAEACDHWKARALDWRWNLSEAADYIDSMRAYCKRVVGTSLAVYWLQMFQGMDAASGATCGHRKIHGRWVAIEVPAMTRKVLARRKELATL